MTQRVRVGKRLCGEFHRSGSRLLNDATDEEWWGVLCDRERNRWLYLADLVIPLLAKPELGAAADRHMVAVKRLMETNEQEASCDK